MSSYKDILTDALDSIGSKVKEVTESGAVRGIYEQGADRMKNVARAAKLTVESSRDSDELKKVYTEIGKLCFEENRTAPGPLYAGLFAQAEELLASLQSKREELGAMKADYEAARGDIEVEIGDFEDIVNATENEGKGN